MEKVDLKKKSGKRMHRKSFYNPKMFNYPLTSQILTLSLIYTKKTSFKNNYEYRLRADLKVLNGSDSGPTVPALSRCKEE